MHYIFILLSEKDGKSYTGSSNDVKRQINDHKRTNELDKGQVANETYLL